MNASQQALQQAISQARQRGPIRATVYLVCSESSCSVQEIEIIVREGKGRKAFQSPLICPRCRTPATFEELEE